MAPDLNSLPPSQSSEGAPVAEQAPLFEESGQGSATLIATPSLTASAASAVPPEPSSPVQRTQHPLGVRLNMRISPHEPAPGTSVADADQRRSSQHQAYRTSSQGRRDGWTGSGLPSPRSPIATALAQGDPHHQRAPSLGELHQELEQEQEAQVNRLLQMIRQQQAQLQQLQSQNVAAHASSDPGSATAASSSAIADDPQALSPLANTHSAGGSVAPALPTQHPRPLSPGSRIASHHSSPHSLRSRSRRSSRSSPIFVPQPATPSGPALTSSESGGLASSSSMGGGRDEAAFYAAETQSLVRENQMLRARIRELERRVRDMETPPMQATFSRGTDVSNNETERPSATVDVKED